MIGGEFSSQKGSRFEIGRISKEMKIFSLRMRSFLTKVQSMSSYIS